MLKVLITSCIFKNIWDMDIFDNETTALLNFCENGTETRFLYKFLPSLGNLRPVFILKCVISGKFLQS